MGLILTIALSVGLLGAANYFYSLDRDTKALAGKAHDLMNNLADVLVTPIWNLDSEGLKQIVAIYRQSDIVIGITLVDEQKQILATTGNAPERPYLTLNKAIIRNGKHLGDLSVAFSGANILAKQREIAGYSIISFLVIIFATVLATSYLLARYLKAPFDVLMNGLEIIAAGDYSREMPPVGQSDITSITDKVNRMAREISKRENALEGNRKKLETLNQAILDIFSCSDTESLIRTTLHLTHKVCGADLGWFLGQTDQKSGSDLEPIGVPVPLICMRGQAFQASVEEVSPNIHLHDGVKRFSFPLKSRHRLVGTMALKYETAVDASEASLLKSLVSLAGLAMVRQSFIRESAFIAAELQVAETVQRAMLPDPHRRFRVTHLAYHYQPVLRVGGDWFSCIESPDGSSMFAIMGDVTGHGLPQGLVTTAVSGAVQIMESLIHQFGDDVIARPSQIINLLNGVISRIAGKSNLRMTCVAVRIDFRQRELHVCNAGHTFPIILSASTDSAKDRSQMVEAHSTVKAAQPMLGDDSRGARAHSYGDESFPFGSRDTLILFTDGLTEAVDAQGKAFNRTFMRHVTSTKHLRSVDGVKRDLIDLLTQHIDQAPVKDDICLLVIGQRAKGQETAGAA